MFINILIEGQDSEEFFWEFEKNTKDVHHNYILTDGVEVTPLQVDVNDDEILLRCQYFGNPFGVLEYFKMVSIDWNLYLSISIDDCGRNQNWEFEQGSARLEEAFVGDAEDDPDIYCIESRHTVEELPNWIWNPDQKVSRYRSIFSDWQPSILNN